MPLEGGLYQWAKLGFNEFTGFMVAWNLAAFRDSAHVGDRLAGGDLSILRVGAERGLAGWEQVVHYGREFRDHRGVGLYFLQSVWAWANGCTMRAP